MLIRLNLVRNSVKVRTEYFRIFMVLDDYSAVSRIFNQQGTALVAKNDWVLVGELIVQSHQSS